MPIKTFRGQLAIGLQKKIRLSTADGLTGYRIKKFQIIPVAVGTADYELVAQVFTTDQSASIASTVNFDDPTLLACHYQKTESSSSAGPFGGEVIIFDNEVFNQDVYVTMTDASGGTNPANFYLELEQVKLNINESTYSTLRNLRDNS